MRKYVNTYRREFERNGKKRSKAPKIQRLVTPEVLQRKRRRNALKKRSLENSKAQAADYHKLLMTRLKEQRERRWVDAHTHSQQPGGMAEAADLWQTRLANCNHHATAGQCWAATF